MSLPIEPWLARWCEWIGTASLQAGALALAVLAADLVLRRFAWPRLRLALHALVIVKLFVPPGFGGGFELPSFGGFGAIGAAASTRLVAGARTSSQGAWLPVAAFGLWLGVAVTLLVGGLVRDRLARRRVRAHSRPANLRVVGLTSALAASLGLRRPPEVVVSRSGEADAVTTPLVFGGRGGFIALPCDADLELCDDDLVHVLLHELAHMRRRDALAAAFVWLGACLFWFHPLVGLVARRLTGLRELACDATVAAHLRGDARRLQGYRATLLRAAEKCLVRSRTAGALGFGSAAALIARLEWLARPRRVRPRLELAGTALVVLLVGAVALPTATRDRAPNRALAVAGGEREAAALVACARATVDAALAGRRPPGCLRLQYSVMALAAQSERTAPRAP